MEDITAYSVIYMWNSYWNTTGKQDTDNLDKEAEQPFVMQISSSPIINMEIHLKSFAFTVLSKVANFLRNMPTN